MKKRWLIGAALLALLLGAFAWWNGRETYKRHVSPPLPDGTRYTFLYPARLQVKSTQNIVYVVNFSNNGIAPSASDEFMRLFGRRSDDTLDSFIAAFPKPLTQANQPPRREDRWQRLGSIRHNIILADKRSGKVFYLLHNESENQHARFEREDTVISESFRILPPGAPVPTP